MIPLLLKYAPYLIVVLILLGMGAGANHLIEVRKLEAVQTDFANYRTRVANAESAAQKAAREALQAQIDQANATDKHNADVIADLTAKADHAADDLRIARGLLAIAGKARPAAGSPVSQAPGQPAAHAATEDAGDRSFVADLAGAVGECRDAIDQLRALQAQLAPQL